MINFFLNAKYYFLFLSLGLLIFYSFSIFSNFDLLPGDNIDSRYLNYILEHFWLWFNQISPHNSFWNMPCLYPAQNTLAYSDILMGLGIIYIPLRLFLNNTYNAYLLTSVILCILNFTAFYYLLKKCFKYKDLSCAIGAFFFAFSLIRYGQMIHIQLLSQSLTIMGLICFIKSNKYPLISFLGCVFIALQFYTSFYMGWFFIFGIFILSLISLFFKNIRQKIIDYIKTHFFFIIANILFTCFLLSPLIIHYLSTGITTYPYEDILPLIPPLKNYFINQSFIDNFIIFKFKNLNADSIYGLGIFTSFILLYGIYSLKTYRKITVIFIIAIFAIINIPLLHKLVYNYIPAGGAIRAVGRFVNILCPIFAVILANFIEKNKKLTYWIVIFLFIIEQIPAQNLFLYSKKEALNDINKYDIPNSCNVIFMDYSKIPANNYLLLNKIEVDGMWLALTYRIYTVNGLPTIPIARKKIDLKPECIIKLK